MAHRSTAGTTTQRPGAVPARDAGKHDPRPAARAVRRTAVSSRPIAEPVAEERRSSMFEERTSSIFEDFNRR